MNAPANMQRSGPAWARYLPSVEVHFPCVGEDEARHRAGLMLLRDMASDMQRKASEEAAEAYHIVAKLATSAAFAGMPVEALNRTRLALIRIFHGAQALDSLFAEEGAEG